MLRVTTKLYESFPSVAIEIPRDCHWEGSNLQYNAGQQIEIGFEMVSAKQHTTVALHDDIQILGF